MRTVWWLSDPPAAFPSDADTETINVSQFVRRIEPNPGLALIGNPVPQMGAPARERMGVMLKKARESTGMTQAQFASGWGKSRSWARQIELGKQQAPWGVVMWVSETLGLPVQTLFGVPGGGGGVSTMTRSTSIGQVCDSIEGRPRRRNPGLALIGNPPPWVTNPRGYGAEAMPGGRPGQIRGERWSESPTTRELGTWQGSLETGFDLLSDDEDPRDYDNWPAMRLATEGQLRGSVDAMKAKQREWDREYHLLAQLGLDPADRLRHEGRMNKMRVAQEAVARKHEARWAKARARRTPWKKKMKRRRR
jgi:transcriptional regulator with XRE-family HTH domain